MKLARENAQAHKSRGKPSKRSSQSVISRGPDATDPASGHTLRTTFARQHRGPTCTSIAPNVELSVTADLNRSKKGTSLESMANVLLQIADVILESRSRGREASASTDRHVDQFEKEYLNTSVKKKY